MIQKNKRNPEVIVTLAYSLIITNDISTFTEELHYAKKHYKKLTTSGLAKLSECLWQIHRKSDAKEIISLLEKRSVSNMGGIYWPGAENNGWYGSDKETTAFVIHALLKIVSDHPLIPKAVLWLQRVRKNGY